MIVIHDSTEPWTQPEPVFDEADDWGPVIDWILSSDEDDDEDDWGWEDEEEDEEEELDLEQMGDWLPDAAALRGVNP